MKKLKIEDGIPIPEQVRPKKSKYVITREMKVNQSIFIQCSKTDLKNEMGKCRSYVDSYGRKQTPMYKYLFRTVDGGFRVWRIK